MPKYLDLQPLPRWIRRQGEGGVNAPEIAFTAGAALFAVDQVVRADPPWLDAWRMRQALTAAGPSARLLRLREDEAGLRDAHHLTRAGDDPGPAGRLHRAWRELARQPARLDTVPLRRLARDLGTDFLPISLDEFTAGQGVGSPIAAAAEATAQAVAALTATQRADSEILGLMLADLVLALRLGWPTPVPLLATAILHPALRQTTERRRPRPGDPGWVAVCHAAYARAATDAYARMIDIGRRAERLLAVAPQVRTKGGAKGIATLLGDDALAAVALKGLGSNRAARRFLDRLVALGAVREFTGRGTFRLYGL